MARVRHATPFRHVPKGFREVVKERPAVRNFGGEKMTIHGFDPDTTEQFPDLERIQEQGISVDNDDVRKQENSDRHGSFKR